MIHLIECPREAMQVIPDFIDSAIKPAYINQLLEVGFDTIDFGSFVSSTTNPQMADSGEVLEMLDLHDAKSKLLATVANVGGAEEALNFQEIDLLGFWLSVSETFQQRNSNASISDTLKTIEAVQNLCERKGKKQVVNLTMGFGNPYGEHYSPELIADLVEKLAQLEIETVSITDTIGMATPVLITELYEVLIQAFPQIQFGSHFYGSPELIEEKVLAALTGGCRRIGGTLLGFGGCLMSNDKLIGTMATEVVTEIIENQGFDLNLNKSELTESLKLARFVFNS